MKLHATIAAALILFFSSAVFSAGKESPDTKKAKQFFLKGKLLVDKGKYEEAIENLEISYDLNPVPLVLYNIALCYEELHKYAEAVTYYNEYLEIGEDEPYSRKEKVFKQIEELSKFLGKVHIEVDEDGAEVILNGKAIGRTPYGVILVEAGKHELVVKKEGFLEAWKKFSIVAGETVTISFTMQNKGKEGEGESERPEKKKGKGKGRGGALWTGGWVAFGAGAALALAGAVTGGMALDLGGDLEGKCPEGVCPPEYHDDNNRMRDLALSSDILLGVGLVGVAAGAVCLILDWKLEKKPENKPSVAAAYPAGVSLTWRF